MFSLSSYDVLVIPPEGEAGDRSSEASGHPDQVCKDQNVLHTISVGALMF